MHQKERQSDHPLARAATWAHRHRVNQLPDPPVQTVHSSQKHVKEFQKWEDPKYETSQTHFSLHFPNNLKKLSQGLQQVLLINL